MADEDEDEYPILSEEEEELLGEWFCEVMEHAYPNPERIGCPEPRVLRDIAFHRQFDRGRVKDLLAHTIQCSECCRDIRRHAEEYRKTTGA